MAPKFFSVGEQEVQRGTFPTHNMVSFLGTWSAQDQFFIHHYPQVVSWRAALNPFIPQSVLVLGIVLSQVQDLALALLNLMRFTQAQSSSLSKSLWMASPSSSESAAPLSLLSSANLLKVDSIPLSMSLMKILNSTGPNIESLTTTFWMQPSNQVLIHQTVHPSHPYLSNLAARLLWGIITRGLTSIYLTEAANRCCSLRSRVRRRECRRGPQVKLCCCNVSYMVVTCHRALSSVDVGAAVTARVEASTQTEPQAADEALQVPGWRDFLEPVSEARRDAPVACGRCAIMEVLCHQMEELREEMSIREDEMEIVRIFSETQQLEKPHTPS
ncbi:hypothetical protein QYF61_015432, partial [Mycteria americana]